MLSFKNSQTVQPLYDYYVETDLDSFDDQPVDYSKKYSDQDTYEVSRSSKSAKKSLPFSSSTELSHSQSGKQTCSDEVKVYCIEGTPRTVSSASSFCDLRDVGTSNLQSPESEVLKRPRKKACLNDDQVLPEKCNESSDCQKNSPTLLKEKDDLNIKEGKSVTFRNEEDISKASSPLMFSRSSSVCSLNSFEQHSIVDDRSSVSAFSTLTSGIISPSELPDSPGEAISPGLSHKTSPKNDTSKDESDNESDNILDQCIKDDIQSEDILEDKNEKPLIMQLSVSNDSVLEQDSLKSDENSDTDENDILVQHCIQLGMPDDPISQTESEVFMNTDYKNSSHGIAAQKDTIQERLSVKSDDDSEADENDILVQRCIQLGMPNNTSDAEVGSKVFSNSEYVSKPWNINDQKEGIKAEDCLKSDDSDADENDILVQRCIQLGMPKKSVKASVDAEPFRSQEYQSHSLNSNSEKGFRNNCPDGISDDDDDDLLLAKCIRAGMPGPKTLSDIDRKQPVPSNRSMNQKAPTSSLPFLTETRSECGKKYSRPPQNQAYAPVHSSATWISNSSFIDVDSMRIYRTEDTPILSPSASLSDLSSLSFNDDKSCHESYLNNSRNSDCSSESEDDELLLQCIRSGMPGAKRAVA